MCARAGHEACEAKAGPDCGEESLAGFRANAPHISDTAPPVWRAPEGPAGPGRAIHSDLAPLVWRAPEGPAGLAAVLVGGGRAWTDNESTRHTSATWCHWCGGRRRVWRARAGFEIDHSERSSRVAISRATGPDGARNTSGDTSNANARQPARAAARSRNYFALDTVERPATQRSRAATTSATWTAFRAAPLRRLSPETTRMRPRLPSTA